jgi:signal transduction histidine kinase
VLARVREYAAAREPRRAPTDLARICASALALLDWEIERDGARVTVDFPKDLPLVEADEVMLQQVVVNLARNALEAMRPRLPEERLLELRAALTDDGVEVAISDSGVGLAETAAEDLFTPFFSTKTGGMGIGLNLCRSIIELHGGRLWFTPNSDRGATFRFIVPHDRGKAGAS